MGDLHRARAHARARAFTRAQAQGAGGARAPTRESLWVLVLARMHARVRKRASLCVFHGNDQTLATNHCMVSDILDSRHCCR